MGRAATREHGRNAAGSQAPAMRFGIVAAVALERVGSAARVPAPAAHGWEGIDPRIQVRDVVDVSRCYLRDERDAAGIGDEVVFGTLRAAIGKVRSSFFPRARRGPSRCR
jgi:hypothetical protein